MANHYVLHGAGIQIDYTVGGNPGFTALSYTEGGTTTNFTASQVTTDTTGLGTLVSVALVKSVDTGGTRWQLSAYSRCSAVRIACRTARQRGSACICAA